MPINGERSKAVEMAVGTGRVPTLAGMNSDELQFADEPNLPACIP
jgi:hypothetical protein